MKQLLSWLIVATLIGLPASAIAQSQPIDRSREYWYAYAGKLPIGATVEVRTADGKRQTAILTIVDPEGITVQTRARIPEPPVRIGYDNIEQLAIKKNGSGVAKAIAVGAGIGAGVFLGLLMVLAASWD